MRFAKGLTAVELSITVAVAGVLAAIAIPSYVSYVNKSKQTEAKANLMSLYSAEKTFYFSQQFYCPRLDAVGFRPTGSLTYRVGFAADSAGTPAGVGSPGCISTATIAACAGVTWTEGLTAVAAGALAGTAVVSAPTPSSFNAEARARLNGATDDIWQIDNTNGTPRNTATGL